MIDLKKKIKVFKRVFGNKYSLELLDLHAWKNKDRRIISNVSFTFGESMSAFEIRICCEKIARWIGGELFGTVNLDFSGNVPSLEMVVEITD